MTDTIFGYLESSTTGNANTPLGMLAPIELETAELRPVSGQAEGR
jgi:hypothetical protein